MYLERFRVDGQVAVITGGGRGIGFACAEALAEAGAYLVLLEPDIAVADAAVASLHAKGYKAEALQGDVRDADRMTACADALAARGTAATILVNNAGIGQSGVDAQNLPDADWLDDGCQSERRFLVCPRLWPTYVGGGAWGGRQHRLDVRHDRQPPATANRL
jgi:hypothetical protein